ARKPHRSCRDVVGITAHARRFVGKVELRIEVGEPGLGLLAFSDIDVDANHPLCVPIAVVGNEAARFDPPNAARTSNTILHVIFALALAESLAAEHIQSLNVFWVHAGQPCAARDLGSSLWITLDGRIAR